MFPLIYSGGLNSSKVALNSSSDFISPLTFKYSLVKTKNNNPKLFFPLLLHGITKSTSLVSLLVSHKAITGMPIFLASLITFLSGWGSHTNINLVSIKFSRLGFVKIPGGYLPVNTLIPVNFENNSTECHPFSLLQTTTTSSGLNWANNLAASIILSFIFCTFKTAKPSGLTL